jgi:hypothetical protein
MAMAWGTTGITEDELERIAAVREYLYEVFPLATIRDSYDTARLAQVFQIETTEPAAVYTAVVSTEFLEQHSPMTSVEVLAAWNIGERLRGVPGREVVITSLGINEEG